LFRKGFLTVCFVGLALGADNAPNTTTEVVVAHDEDIIPLHASMRETTLIVLPAAEKAMGVFCGDRTYWNVDVIPGAERYVAVKPSKPGISTDIHIVTDHNNSYTFQAVEGASSPVALKLFVKPADASSLEKPPVFVAASEVTGLKQQLAEAQAALKKTQETAAAEVKAKSDQVRAEYPERMQFAYNFKKDKPPFNVEAIWHDNKFTYIRAHPQEAPALYEVKDGKPNLIQFELRPDGLYFIPKILDRAYLEIGKQKLDVWK
jgi:type IV secretory pathway VirB9-like protein